MQVTKGSISQIKLPPVYNNVVDGNITVSEFDQKAYHLQCRYKDLVYKITNKWRYGIFCPEDSDTIIEIKALLRILICYGKETEEIPPDDSQVPECYNDYTTFKGVDLNTVPTLASVFPVTSPYFFITSPFTNNYYILKLELGSFSGSEIIANTLSSLIYGLDQGTPVVIGPPITNGLFFLVDVLCSGDQTDLDNALIAAQGVTVTSSGLSDAQIIKIVKRIEKLLQCSH